MIKFTMMMLHGSLIGNIERALARERKNRRTFGLM